ncbi:MAG TPA: DMT family transporter [Dehalococcoidia bacterium]|nr:DMT family transporter [Dehalococcoidia bacterium]
MAAITRVAGALTRPGAPSSAVPLAAVATAASLWASGGVYVKLADMDGVSVSCVRMWLGAALTFGVVGLMRRPLSPGIWRAAPAGMLFGVNTALFFSALHLSSIANANLIAALQPAVVLLIAGPMFGEAVGRREVAWTAFAIAGIAIVIVGSTGSPTWSPLGDLLAVGALLTFTAYFAISKQLRESLATVEYFAMVQLVAASVITPFALLRPGGMDAPHPMAWLWIALITAGGVTGHLLVNWAHPRVDITASSLMMLVAPVVAAITAWLVLGEHLGLWQVVGGCVTLVAMVAFVSRGDARRPTEVVAVEAPPGVEPIVPRPDR